MNVEDLFLSNILSSVSILVCNLGKSNFKKEGGRKVIEVDLSEVNFTLGSALDKLSKESFDTVAVKPQKYLFGAIYS